MKNLYIIILFTNWLMGCAVYNKRVEYVPEISLSPERGVYILEYVIQDVERVGFIIPIFRTPIASSNYHIAPKLRINTDKETCPKVVYNGDTLQSIWSKTNTNNSRYNENCNYGALKRILENQEFELGVVIGDTLQTIKYLKHVYSGFVPFSMAE